MGYGDPDNFRLTTENFNLKLENERLLKQLEECKALLWRGQKEFREGFDLMHWARLVYNFLQRTRGDCDCGGVDDRGLRTALCLRYCSSNKEQDDD
jgi:hypothetical protein